MADLQASIEELWERRGELSPADADAAKLVEEAIELLDTGQVRVAEVDSASDEVVVHEWLKKSILLFFTVRGMETMEVGPFEYADKLPLKHGFAEAGVRALPGASARWGSYLGRGVVLMPSYVNIGAYVGDGSMVDTWATVASCAQIGARVHLAGGVGIGGVLEPPNAVPVVVEDDAFVGSRCMVTGGARIGKGAVLGAGSFLDPSIPVIDAETGAEISRGVVPPWCVAIRASRRREYPGGEFFVPCVLVIKRLSEGERHDKAQLNQVLRDHGAST
jgi:2,3,4,5-tetrahydropyridine-2,6-dicarboxylate N-succinyltransferase